MALEIPTSEAFQQELQKLAESFLGTASTIHHELVLRSAFEQLIDRFYFIGGLLADRDGSPILDRSDVELVITRTDHRISLSTIRRTNHV